MDITLHMKIKTRKAMKKFWKRWKPNQLRRN